MSKTIEALKAELDKARARLRSYRRVEGSVGSARGLISRDLIFAEVLAHKAYAEALARYTEAEKALNRPKKPLRTRYDVLMSDESPFRCRRDQ